MYSRFKKYSSSQGGQSDVAIYAPRTFGANERNTDARFSYPAHMAGHLVLTGYSPGHERMIIASAAQRSLPETYADIARRHAEALIVDEDFASRPIKIGWGDSGRGMLITLMQSSEFRPFDAILSRDSVNLRAPESLVQGGIRLLADLRPPSVRVEPDVAQYIRDFQATLEEDDAERYRRKHPWRFKFQEMKALGGLMCGTTTSVDALEAVAADPDVALRYVGFARGSTGKRAQIAAFGPRLERLRDEALPLSINPSGPAGIRADAFSGTHADITNPALALTHLSETLSLLPDGYTA
jgi:hypothetical protein